MTFDATPLVFSEPMPTLLPNSRSPPASPEKPFKTRDTAVTSLDMGARTTPDPHESARGSDCLHRETASIATTAFFSTASATTAGFLTPDRMTPERITPERAASSMAMTSTTLAESTTTAAPSATGTTTLASSASTSAATATNTTTTSITVMNDDVSRAIQQRLDAVSRNCDSDKHQSEFAAIRAGDESLTSGDESPIQQRSFGKDHSPSEARVVSDDRTAEAPSDLQAESKQPQYYDVSSPPHIDRGLGTNTCDLESAGYLPLAGSLDDHLDIESVQAKLQANGDMAVVQLCSEALKHAAEGITHPERKIAAAINRLRNSDAQQRAELRAHAGQLIADLRAWLMANRVKAVLMFLGLGLTAFKAKTIGSFMEDNAQNFIHWGQSATTGVRFLGFVGLMAARLFVSTVVPPTSPAFGVILQAATPAAEKWTAMPLFLAASTVAGALPYLLDKFFQIFLRKDFMFTSCMKTFVDAWPLTCWTGPAMTKVFQGVGGGKMGASLAVIVAHAAPFMGAQTTMVQRYFLPHPLDTIISQPFGMSEDLISMALAEAASDPMLASVSLTLIIGGFNSFQFAAFSKFTDYKALASMVINAFLGFVFFVMINPLEPDPNSSQGSSHVVLALVAGQLAAQLFLASAFTSVLSCLSSHRVNPLMQRSSTLSVAMLD